MKPTDPTLSNGLDGLGPKKRGGQHDAKLHPYKANIERAFKNGASLRAVVALLNKHIKPKLGVHALVGFCFRNAVDWPRKKPKGPRKDDKGSNTDELPLDEGTK